MTQMTYASLRKALETYAERPDQRFRDSIDTFIEMAENRIAVKLKQQGFQTVVVGTLPEEPSMEKPEFWRQTISFSYTTPAGERGQLLLRSYEFLKQTYPDATPGTPRYYADYNATNFALGPVPLTGCTFELLYYARLQPLSEDNQTNWLTLNAPQILMAAASYQAALFSKNDEQLARWKVEYGETSAEVLIENAGRIGDRSGKVTNG